MRTITKLLLPGVLLAVSLMGSGGRDSSSGPAEIAVSNSVAPAGGTAQVTFSMTEPQPIGSTGSGFALHRFGVDGVALWSPSGEACGVGLIQDGVLRLNAIDPSAELGTSTDGPFFTVTMSVPANLTAGTSIPFTWTSDSSISLPSGPLQFSVKPGSVTIGGTISISGVYPGGGTYPAGSEIRILGSGFQGRVRLQTPVKYSSITVTPDEIDLTLKEQTTLNGQSFQLTNPDGSTVTYFSYLRGVLVSQPSEELLQNAEFAFPVQTHALASVVAAGDSDSDDGDDKWVALALQNPNPGPVVVTIAAPDQNVSSAVTLPSGGRLVDTLSALVPGAHIQAGETVTVTSTSMIQIMGINGDENAKTLTPFVPVF